MSRTSIVCLSLVLLACGKDSTGTGPSATTTDYFVRGKGMRPIWTTVFPTVGLGDYRLNEMSLTSDGYLHTVYSHAKALPNGAPASVTSYRVKINVATGDTVATTGIPPAYAKVNLGNYTIPCRRFGVVPYTDVFAYIDESTRDSVIGIKGTPNFQTVPAPFTGFAAIYPDRSYACVTSENANDGWRTVATYTSKGVAQPRGSKLLTPRTVVASMELSTSGVPLTFVMDASDSLFVINYASGARLAAIRLPMIAEYIDPRALPNYRPDVFMQTKRNRAGTRVSGLIHNAAGRAVSTFVYDIASNTLEAKVQNARFDNVVFLSPAVTFDEVGNVYYFGSLSQQQISRITPAGGDAIYRIGFLGGARTGNLVALQHIDDKLFVVIQAAGNARLPDERARHQMMIAVVE